MPGLLPDVDPDGLLEFSVVYTDRSLNHMSQSFQQVMRDISRSLRHVYNGSTAVIVPGSGTFAMEAVARQYAGGAKCLVVRNGWFSYRWSQIFEAGDIPSDVQVMMARQLDDEPQSPFAPAPVDEVVDAIANQRPEVVFAPHVETASGMILPDDYLAAIANAVHDVGGLFVLDCVASGAMWVDMKGAGVDVLISAPQKGWSSSPCCGLVVLGERARERLEATSSTSFACDLGRWHEIMQAYENGAHAYHATMPTDSLRKLRDAMAETVGFGLDRARECQQSLGTRVRSLLTERGYPSVAADGYQAPTVVVSYTDDPDLQSGKKFVAAGVQIAAGVPLQCAERDDFKSFRVGLFGLDKLQNVDRTVAAFTGALDKALG